MASIEYGHHQANVEGQAQVSKRSIPTLFIGLGGTGKDTLLMLRKRFYDDSRDYRQFIRYLVIDTNKQEVPKARAAEDFEPVRLRVEESVPCQIKEGEFYQAFDLMERQRDPRFASWLKPSMRDIGPGAVLDGAGTHRQFGRMAFMWNEDKIRTSIRAQLREVLEQAAVAAQGKGVADTVESAQVEVVIVTSLAGGTGSGMLLDVSYLVKDIVREHEFNGVRTNTTLIAALAGLFRDFPDFEACKRNTYAALLELEHYGTPWSGDQVFIGKSNDNSLSNAEVGFEAPWRQQGDNFIRGVGWDVCYLIDHSTPLGLHHRPKPDETYQMIADYLYLDFQHGPLAEIKRANRSNLVQYKQNYLWREVRRELPGGKVNQAGQREVVVYRNQNGCTFSSFGLSEIRFDKDVVLRAASYRLAWQLIQQRWLGRDRKQLEQADTDVAKKDVYDPPAEDASSFSIHPDRLIESLFQTGQGNYFTAAMSEANSLETLPFTSGVASLRATIGKHQALLNGSGQALQTIAQRARALAGDATELGPIRSWLKRVFRTRLNQHGILLAKLYSDTYGKILAAVAGKANEIEKGEVPDSFTPLARLDEADRMYPPVRRVSQSIEYPRACASVRGVVLGSYRKAAAPYMRRLIQKTGQYIGTDGEVPVDLAFHRTLNEYAARSEQLLKQIATWLDERFADTKKQEGTFRSQSPFFSDWNEERYEDQIRRAVVNYSAVGATEHSTAIDWDKLSEIVLEKLRQSGTAELQRVHSLTDLLDQCFERLWENAKDTERLAEKLATACRKLLLEARFDVFDGRERELGKASVIDMLMLKCNDVVRRETLERLVTHGVPYFPIDPRATAVNPKYRATFSSLLGKKEGKLERSADNETALLRELTEVFQALAGRDQQVQVLEGANSLIFCREVWGLPIQMYGSLEPLYQAYAQESRLISDCRHINHHFSAEEMPDIRVLDPHLYEKIRDNIENVMFAMIRGTITCDNDSKYVVAVPNSHGAGIDKWILGSKLHRIIKKCCEEETIHNFLEKARTKWEGYATPLHWAAIYASAIRSYDESRRVLRSLEDVARTPPLNNCFLLLVLEAESRLKATPEGLRWHEHLRIRNEHEHSLAEVSNYQKVHRELVEQGILVRSSEHVPIYRIVESNLEHLKLPPPSPGAGNV